MKALLPFCFILGLAFSLTSCKDKIEDFKPVTAREFFMATPGKYITYRLDSLVFVQQGRVQETHSYQEKDEVDGVTTDALGRTSYRIYRSVRDTAGLTPWRAAGTYLVTPTDGFIETLSDNMRSIRLVTPLAEGSSWKGNRFIAPDVYASRYLFNNDDEINDWDFTITGAGESVQLNGKTYTNVVSVQSIDDAFNVPITVPSSFANRTYLASQFAKDIGLIYEKYTMWEYQPNPNGTPYTIGFGVTRSILDHN